MATGTNNARKIRDIPERVRGRIEEAAAWRGVSVERFVLDAAAKEAEQVIESERLFRLSREDAERLLALLEWPPSRPTALRKAAQTHQRLIRGRA